MPVRTFARIVALVAFALLPVAHAQGPAWKKFRTPYFTMLSAGDDKTSLTWATEMQLYFTQLARYGKMDPQRPPLTVVMFADDAGVAPFKPEYKLAGENAAYFGTTKSAAYFLLTQKSDRVAARAAAYHRALHWMTGSDARTDMPAWYTEGLAGVFATFTVSGSDIVIGSPIRGYGGFLSPNSLLSIHDLFAVTPEAARAGEYDRSTVFFAESWLLVHYLLIDQPSLASAPARYLALLERRVPEAAAFQQAFGMSEAEMDQRIAELARRGSVKTLRGKVDIATAQRAIERVPFDAVDLELATGQAYLGTGHHDEAETHLRRALAARPKDPAILLSLAELAMTGNDIPGTRALCDQLIASDPNNAAAYYLRGRVILKANITHAGTLDVAPIDARAACDDLMRALRLAPQWMDVVPMVSGALPVAKPRRDEDFVFLRQAAAGWPPSDVALAAVAALDEQAGNAEKARDEYEQVLKMDPPPKEKVRTFVVGRLDQLKGGGSSSNSTGTAREPDPYAELATLLDQKDYAKLSARLDELSAKANSLPARAVCEMYRSRMVAAQTMDQAQQAIDDGDNEKAEALLHELLERPNLALNTKLAAQGMLNALKLRPKLPSKSPHEAAEPSSE